MPIPLLAHQAPILPLRLLRPRAWNGTALVVGSVAPDLMYLRMLPPQASGATFGHSLLGQFVFCLPVTLVVVLLIGRFRLGEVLVARLGPRFAWLVAAATDVTTPGGLRRAALSALVGSFSHVGLDALTHSALPRWLPVPTVHLSALPGVSLQPSTVTQVVVSAGCALVSVWLLLKIARAHANVTPPPRRGLAFVVTLAFAGAALGVRLARPAMRDPDAYFDAGPVYVWGFVAFFAVTVAAAGVLLAGVVLAFVDRRAPAA